METVALPPIVLGQLTSSGGRRTELALFQANADTTKEGDRGKHSCMNIQLFGAFAKCLASLPEFWAEEGFARRVSDLRCLPSALPQTYPQIRWINDIDGLAVRNFPGDLLLVIRKRMARTDGKEGRDSPKASGLPRRFECILGADGGAAMDMNHKVTTALEAYLRHPTRTGHFRRAITGHFLLQFDKLDYRTEVLCNLLEKRNEW
jgi:hypothetical protein